MKIGFFSTELFWGGLLILLGLSMIIKTVFGIDIPIIRTLIAIFLIYMGFTIISDIGYPKKNKQTIAFQEKTVHPEKIDNYYSIRFGKGVIDLTHLQQLDKPQKVTINTMFGEAIVKINKNIPTKIKVKAIFGNATMPDSTQISSGKYTYKTDPDMREAAIEVDATVAFGNLKVITV